MARIKKTLKDIIYISRITKVTKKKLRILLSVFLSNTTVFIDILIIVLFASLISGETSDIEVVQYFINNIYFLPFIVLFRFITNFVEKANIFSLGAQVEKNLRVYLIKEVYKKGNYSIADATFYINSLSGHVGYFYSALTSFLNSCVQLLVYGSFLLFTDLETIAAFAVGGLVLFFPTRILLKLGRKYMHEAWLNAQQTGRDIERVIQNIFLIKILGTSEYEIDEYDKTTTKLQSSQLKNQIYGTINSLIPNFITVFTISVLIVFFDILKSLTLEFLGITLRLVQTVGSLNTSMNMMINSHVHLTKFIELENNKLVEREGYYTLDKSSNNAIEIEDLSFKYYGSEEYIFESLNLIIPKSEHTVLTGPNGSGKSTLLGLISKVFYPQEGLITINTNEVGYVGVTPLILNSTLRENFLYGNQSKIEDKNIKELMNEFELFNSDEKTLDTIVSNKTLSSGQMQKIAFIRSLLANAKLLLLDESTSNLDIKTKELIFNILSNKKITIINSTHNYEDFHFDNHLRIIYEGDKRKIKSN